jgi:hypothetical protein
MSSFMFHDYIYILREREREREREGERERICICIYYIIYVRCPPAGASPFVCVRVSE